ncbi:MAG: TIGR01459 family HAD-type hydrolase [Paracoccus denitrificans]|nr:MAG: TIGR01459 family HAD-type hydrolase [Paracoccus denitrificans]PZO83183.1 MAG: TIGR01459 family HAD-type hydrolase [Paracoccus denitrificans]
MTQIIPALSDIGSDYDVLFCDIWGCVHNGRAAYPAAIAALQQYRQDGGKVALVTNAPRPARFVAQSLDRMGVPRDAWDVIVTSGDAAQDAMFHGAVGRRVWHLGPDKDDGFFEPETAEEATADPISRVGLQDAEGIVCTGPFNEMTETPEDYRDRLTVARDRGLKLLCANPDIVVDVGETRIYCAGALAQFYEQIGGTSLYYGKPHDPIYDLARRQLGVDRSARALAIGDGIATDILGAANQGVDALFVTGGLAASELGDDVENPDNTLMLDWLQRAGHAPRYAIGRLR